MSWKSFACMAALGAMASTAAAVPSIEIVDNADGTGVLNIVTDAAGSLGAELTLELTGATLTGATINTTLFDDANPGDNPYIAGSPVGGDTTGLGLELAENRLFAAYGSGDLGVGTFKFLDFTYDGSGTADSAGNVAQASANNAVSDGPVDLSPVVANIWDFEPDGDVDITDFGFFADAFNNGAPLPGTNGYGDGEPDGDVDITDFGNFADAFNASAGSSAAIPEPTAALLGLIALAGLGVRRSV